MNYINRLECQVADLQEKLENLTQALRGYHTELSYSHKFVGVDADGDRKDWVATGDVTYRIEKILS